MKYIEIKSCVVMFGGTKNKLCCPILEALKSVKVRYVGSKQKCITIIQSGLNKRSNNIATCIRVHKATNACNVP